MLLAIETAGTGFSIALFDPHTAQIRGVRLERGTQGRADRLIQAIDSLLQEQDLSYVRLQGLAVGRGPGTFTGIRAGVAAARGLSLAMGVPVSGVTTFEALAIQVVPHVSDSADLGPPRPVTVLFDARRGEIYRQDFSADLDPEAPPRILAAERMLDGLRGPRLLCGSGLGLLDADRALPELPAGLEVAAASLDAVGVARAAARRLARGELPRPGFELEPLYLRAPDARPQAAPVLRSRS